MKDMVFKPLPVTMVELRHLISEASHDISEEMVRKAVVCMRTREAKLVAMKKKGFNQMVGRNKNR